MNINKRRLVKDLPFDGLSVGTVLWKGGRGHGGNYSVSNIPTFYESGGSSDNGIHVFDKSVEDILDVIWDNEEWFEDADLTHIEIVPATDSITLRFKPIDKEEAVELAKGIQHVLKHLQDGSYVWNKFKDMTTSFRSR